MLLVELCFWGVLAFAVVLALLLMVRTSDIPPLGPPVYVYTEEQLAPEGEVEFDSEGGWKRL